MQKVAIGLTHLFPHFSAVIHFQILQCPPWSALLQSTYHSKIFNFTSLVQMNYYLVEGMKTTKQLLHHFP